MSTVDQDPTEDLIRLAEKDTQYLREVILPRMEKRGELWPFSAVSYIEQFSPRIALACPVVSTCERGRTTREKISQFYLNLDGKPSILVEEIHYHDDDLHSRNHRREMETYLRFVALGIINETIGIVENDDLTYNLF